MTYKVAQVSPLNTHKKYTEKHNDGGKMCEYLFKSPFIILQLGLSKDEVF